MTPLPPLQLETGLEDWPLSRPFSIARGSKTTATVLAVSVTGDGATGRGEGVPYARYGETADDSLKSVSDLADCLARGGLSPEQVLSQLPAGAARNALDCALWDWRAKAAGRPVWRLAGLSRPAPVQTAVTVSLDSPEAMAEEARRLARSHRLLKLKLGRPAEDAARMAAIRDAAPDARLIVDANEGWTSATYPDVAVAAAEQGVELIEQPLPAGDDAVLAEIPPLVPVCADESFRAHTSLASIAPCYQAVNVKLDKSGGFTPALAAVSDARELGFRVMIGSMVATSLGVAPALLLAGMADWADIDGPVLLARDREHALVWRDDRLYPPHADLWG